MEQQLQPGEKLSPRVAIPKWAAIAVAAFLTSAITAVAIPYYRLSKRVDRQLASGAFQHTFTYFAAPEILSVGDPISPMELAAITRAGNSGVEIQTANGQVSAIIDLANHRHIPQTELAPQLIANLSDEGREKRRMVKYQDIPPILVHAIISAEDKRFFEHSGVDVLRIAKASYVDLREHRKEQGASTISMQLARNLWLDRDKSWKRKMTEAFITLHLEHKLTKEQIFEDYCNLVYLGNQGTFSIDGFGEASRMYFNKDIRELNIAEAATLAGLIQRPSYLNPFHHPERALERRNRVLSLMRGNKYITPAEYAGAAAAPLALHPLTGDQSEAQYFLDIAGNEAARDLDQRQPGGSANVYTTIDPRLQQAAEKAIADGMQLVDKLLAHRKQQPYGARPEVALIALDPHTGEVKALCGGRDYAISQLNRVLSKRPPGSVFKPFVYTAALNTAVAGGSRVLTPASIVDDSPTTFQYGNQTYSPNNFKSDFRGAVTFRAALAHSLNVATVKVGEMVGFDSVAALARRAGLNDGIRATPALALGAYQVTPLEMARAYTIFANGGTLVQPAFISAINAQNGGALYRHVPQTQRVLDPRVAFVMVDMLQEVMRSGTAAGVRARGFRLPAAGKTGTSHDGWFAGFTSQLLCLVWVGFDDYSELGLEGARSALPIWTEFMVQATRYKQYGNTKPFAPPSGVVNVPLDLASGQACPGGSNSYFVDGTEPTGQCAPQEIEVEFTPGGGALQRVADHSGEQK